MTRFPVLICVLVLGTASCAEIPTAELTAYKQAFGSAKQSAETVIADYSNALQEASVIAPGSADSPFPKVFEPESFLSGDAGDTNVASRLRALEVSGQYNNVLVALAQGKSEEGGKGRGGCFLEQPVDARVIGSSAERDYRHCADDRWAGRECPAAGRIQAHRR